MVQNQPASAGDTGDMSSVPGLGDPLEKGMAAHSSILAWRIPRTKEPGSYSPQDHKELNTTKVT